MVLIFTKKFNCLHTHIPTHTHTMVECSLMVRWVVGSILYGGPIELFLVIVIAPQLVNKGHGVCYPLWNGVYVKYPLLLVRKSNPCRSGSRFSLLLSEWSFTIYLLPLPYLLPSSHIHNIHHTHTHTHTYTYKHTYIHTYINKNKHTKQTAALCYVKKRADV